MNQNHQIPPETYLILAAINLALHKWDSFLQILRQSGIDTSGGHFKTEASTALSEPRKDYYTKYLNEVLERVNKEGEE
jgi:hypothetical protein